MQERTWSSRRDSGEEAPRGANPAARQLSRRTEARPCPCPCPSPPHRPPRGRPCAPVPAPAPAPGCPAVLPSPHRRWVGVPKSQDIRALQEKFRLPNRCRLISSDAPALKEYLEHKRLGVIEKEIRSKITLIAKVRSNKFFRKSAIYLRLFKSTIVI